MPAVTFFIKFVIIGFQMNKLISFIKREPVLFAAVLLAVVSVVIIRPAPYLCLQFYFRL